MLGEAHDSIEHQGKKRVEILASNFVCHLHYHIPFALWQSRGKKKGNIFAFISHESCAFLSPCFQLYEIVQKATTFPTESQ